MLETLSLHRKNRKGISTRMPGGGSDVGHIGRTNGSVVEGETAECPDGKRRSGRQLKKNLSQ